LKNILKKTINYLVFTFIAILLLYLAFKNVDLKKMYSSLINDVNYYWILFSLVFAFLGFIIRAVRWKILIEPLGYNPKNKNLVNAVIIGYFANIAVPRLGEITRCASLNKTDKIPVDSLLGTVIVERIIDVLVMFILMAVVLVAKFELYGNFFKTNVYDPLHEKLFVSLYFWILAISFLILILLIYFIFKNKLKKLTVFNKVTGFAKGILVGLKTFITMKKKWQFIIYTFLMWFVYLLMTYVVFFSIKPTSNLTLLDGLFILIAGSLGMTAPVQSGFGAYHWMISLGLILYKIPQQDGLLYATLCHESQMILVVILGSIAMYKVFSKKHKNNNV